MKQKDKNKETGVRSRETGVRSREAAPKERKKNWQEYTATVEDIKAFLDGRVWLRYNVVTGQTECHALSDFGQPTAEGYEPVTDRTVNSLWRELSAQKQVRKADLQNVIDSDYVPDYDPLRFYLDRLPQWDGRSDHILALSLSVQVKGGVDEQLLFAEYLRKWLVGMVAAWVDDTVVNNVVLVLIGAQGLYKTTWFHYLLPPELRSYFRIKTNSTRMTRDDLLTLTQYALLCYEELDTMRPAELNELKSAVTMPYVDERPAYGRYHEHRRHIASFCGTGNNVQFLSDLTGNRRWLPFEVASIDNPRAEPPDYAAVYAQAYALYRQGFRYWFSQAEVERLAKHNRQFETPRLEVELVQQYFRRPEGQEPGEFMPVGLAMQIVGANITQKLSSVMLGRAFVDLGFQRRTWRNVRGYVVVRRSAEEMRSMRQQMAHTDTDDTDVF